MAISRRVLLIGSTVAGLAAAGAIFEYRRRSAPSLTDPDSLARDYTKRVADVTADYLAGRIVARKGWIMSETEAAALPQG